MKLVVVLSKIICVAANWYFAIMMGLAACVNQSVGQLVAAQLWILVILMIFPAFKKRRDLNANKRS